MSSPIVAIVVEFDQEKNAGLVGLDGKTLPFSYRDGESVVCSNGTNVRFSGKHHQANGCSLKIPTSGDALVLHSGQEYPTWAYFRSWEYARARQETV